MKVACSHASKSAQELKVEVQTISSSTSLTNCGGLYTSVEGILEGTMKVMILQAIFTFFASKRVG